MLPSKVLFFIDSALHYLKLFVVHLKLEITKELFSKSSLLFFGKELRISLVNFVSNNVPVFLMIRAATIMNFYNTTIHQPFRVSNNFII